MDYIVQDQAVVLTHWPGKGAWTYYLLIPNSQHLVGTWGNIKVSGTLDDYAFHSKNLAPIKGGDKILSVNAAVRKRLGKQAGDTIRVTMYREAAPAPSAAADVLACLEDAGVLAPFSTHSAEEREALLRDVLSQQDAASQEKRILALITFLAKSGTTAPVVKTMRGAGNNEGRG